jgi:hypothetical protein
MDPSIHSEEKIIKLSSESSSQATSSQTTSSQSTSKPVVESLEDVDVEEYNHFVWEIIDEYFHSHPKAYVQHHTDSYNHFMDSFVQQTFRERNPVVLQTAYNEETKEYKHTVRLYFGGKEGNRIYFGKPVIYDKDREHYMFPNEARLRNMTYGTTLHYDLDIEYEDIFTNPQEALYPEPSELGNVIQATFQRTQRQAQQVVEDYTLEHMATTFAQPTRQEFRESVAEQNTTLDRLAETVPEQEEAKMTGGTAISGKRVQKRSQRVNRILLGRLPMMLNSKYCMISFVIIARNNNYR